MLGKPWFSYEMVEKKTTTKTAKKATKVKKTAAASKGVVEEILKDVKKVAKEVVKEVKEVTEGLVGEEASADVPSDEGKKPAKKKEVKMLSEKELKKAMTDTKATLVPLTDYIRCSVHLGTKVITPDMRKYVYKRRADGLAVINTNLIDDKIRDAVEFMKDFEPQDIFIACKREAGWPAVDKFSKVTGIKSFTKKYPAGIITNLNLDDFFEAKLVLICDPWVDKNALNDSMRLGLPVIGICDTNNYTKGVTKKIIGNNKSSKSIGLLLYILAREYLKSKGQDKEAKALKMEDFTGRLEEVETN